VLRPVVANPLSTCVVLVDALIKTTNGPGDLRLAEDP
jgi:hypothetical protein